MNMMQRMLMDVLTIADGKTFCHARVSGFATTLVYNGMTLASFITTHHFDNIAYATGYAAILTAVCGGAWMKKDTEPQL